MAWFRSIRIDRGVWAFGKLWILFTDNGPIICWNQVVKWEPHRRSRSIPIRYERGSPEEASE